MDRDRFREALLEVMERKKHWAWPLFTSGKVAKERLHIHLEQEYAVYIRDFALLLGRVYEQCPVAEVRRELVENMLEEETGAHSGGRPHADMFLDYPRGLGMDLSRFEQVVLLPDAARYRAALDEATLESGWEVGAAVTTLFLEGTEYERGELDPGAPKRPEPPLDQHPLVVHYGLPLEHLQLARAHRLVEKDHRAAAWQIVLHHVEPARRDAVVTSMQEILRRWLAYRDDVAAACGVAPA
jgi:pyrroloquinoline-quinone synthase